jgi:hypothetical protein
MDVLTMRDKIEIAIQEIEKLVDRLPEAAMEKANTLANYEKEIAITILQIKNGVRVTFEGEDIKNIAATLIPSVAKGICYKESFDKEMGEGMYKGLITTIEAVKAILNGYQSMNKVLQ